MTQFQKWLLIREMVSLKTHIFSDLKLPYICLWKTKFSFKEIHKKNTYKGPKKPEYAHWAGFFSR